ALEFGHDAFGDGVERVLAGSHWHFEFRAHDATHTRPVDSPVEKEADWSQVELCVVEVDRRTIERDFSFCPPRELQSGDGLVRERGIADGEVCDSAIPVDRELSAVR